MYNLQLKSYYDISVDPKSSLLTVTRILTYLCGKGITSETWNALSSIDHYYPNFF